MGGSLGTLRPVSQTDLVFLQMGEHGTAEPATPAFVKTGGVYNSAPTAVASGQAVIAWLDARGYHTPHAEAVLIHSFTTLGSGAAGTATSTAQTGLGQFKELEVYANVTFSQGAATNTLLLLLDARLDGTNYVNLASFPAITTAGGYLVHLSKARVAGATSDVAVDAGAGTIRAVGFGDAVQVRRQITGTATTQFSASIYITNMIA